MLKSEHSIVRYDFDRQTIHPDRLVRGRDDAFLPAMEECLAVYRSGIQRQRNDLHDEVESILSRATSSPPRRIASFCKLLDDSSEYAQGAAKAASLRKRVFTAGAGLHPVVTTREGIFENDIDTAKASLTRSLGMSWEQIADGMFADVIELQKLMSFDEAMTASKLLSRYNVTQTQACLYRATRVRIDAFAQAPFILRQAKLAGLMHRVSQGAKPRKHYRFILDGPVTTLRETSRYGIKFAHMISGLLQCDDWRLLAEVLGPNNRKFALRLSNKDGLTSDAATPQPFDSKLEETVQNLWDAKPAEGWAMTRDQEFVVRGQTIYTPDFVLTHQSHAKIYVEVVGYWTPEYLEHKRERLVQFTSDGLTDAKWLLMFEKPPTKAKYDQLIALDLPIVVLSKQKKPTQWIQAVQGKPRQKDVPD